MERNKQAARVAGKKGSKQDKWQVPQKNSKKHSKQISHKGSKERKEAE